MNATESTVLAEAHRVTMATYNSAWSWRDHPTYNTKTDLVTQIDQAIGAVEFAESMLEYQIGDHADFLRGLRVAVRSRKAGTPFALPTPPYRPVAVAR